MYLIQINIIIFDQFCISTYAFEHGTPHLSKLNFIIKYKNMYITIDIKLIGHSHV